MAEVPLVRPVPANGNLPLSSALFSGSQDYGDLARYGYIEREYFLTGKASVRDENTGEVLVAASNYVTRIIVRRPLDPKAFSGHVVIEPFHAQLEKTDFWRQLHPYIVRDGDAWIGITIKPYSLDMEPTSEAYAVGGVPALKAYDPERYGSLELAPDMRPSAGLPVPVPPQSYDLLAQLATLLKSDDASSPLHGLPVKKTYLVGAGVNGEVIAGYVRTHMDEQWRLANGKPLFDGYLAGAINRLLDKPVKDAAFVVFRSENELDRTATLGFLDKTADTPSFRVYNVPGISHLSARNRPDAGTSFRQLNAVLPKPELNLPYVIENSACRNINDEPVDLFLGAIFERMKLWTTKGVALPPSPPVRLQSGSPAAKLGNPSGYIPNGAEPFSIVSRDPVSGNIIGGVRLPWVEAPVARYPVRGAGPPGAGGPPGGASPPGPPRGAAPPAGAGGVVEPTDAWPRASKDPVKFAKGGPGPCFLYNPRVAYDPATLRKLYTGYADYLGKFEHAKAAAVKAGWLLKEDAQTLRPRGNPEDF